jgi:hypothetical protein
MTFPQQSAIFVCGGRNWKNKKSITDKLAKLPRDTILIGLESSCPTDVFHQVAKCAEEMNLVVLRYKPNWSTFGRAAGFVCLRNMLYRYNILCGLVFHCDFKHSRGTKGIVNVLESSEIPYLLIEK